MFLVGGHAKMLMLAHISPEADSYGETISTLKFAQRVATVELGASHVNKESSEVRQLKEEVKFPMLINWYLVAIAYMYACPMA